jgi:putative transposase
MKKKTTPYAGHRYPAEIISHAVWMYFRFTLSFRDVEELLASRGAIVSHEAIRQWALKFGQAYANSLRRRQPRRGDKWHLDEVVLTMNGKHHYRWRAVIRTGTRLTFWFNPDVTGTPPSASSASCSRGCAMSLGSS